MGALVNDNCLRNIDIVTWKQLLCQGLLWTCHLSPLKDSCWKIWRLWFLPLDGWALTLMLFHDSNGGWSSWVHLLPGPQQRGGPDQILTVFFDWKSFWNKIIATPRIVFWHCLCPQTSSNCLCGLWREDGTDKTPAFILTYYPSSTKNHWNFSCCPECETKFSNPF